MRQHNHSNTDFQTVRRFAETSGLSQKFIRKALRDGKLPHIKVGNTYQIATAAAIATLTAQAEANRKED